LKEKNDGIMSFGNDGSSKIVASCTVTLGSKDALEKCVDG